MPTTRTVAALAIIAGTSLGRTPVHCRRIDGGHRVYRAAPCGRRPGRRTSAGGVRERPARNTPLPARHGIGSDVRRRGAGRRARSGGHEPDHRRHARRTSRGHRIARVAELRRRARRRSRSRARRADGQSAPSRQRSAASSARTSCGGRTGCSTTGRAWCCRIPHGVIGERVRGERLTVDWIGDLPTVGASFGRSTPVRLVLDSAATGLVLFRLPIGAATGESARLQTLAAQHGRADPVGRCPASRVAPRAAPEGRRRRAADADANEAGGLLPTSLFDAVYFDQKGSTAVVTAGKVQSGTCKVDTWR